MNCFSELFRLLNYRFHDEHRKPVKKLDFNHVEKLVNQIKSEVETGSGKLIFLLAPWGAGKTAFLDHLKTKLKKIKTLPR